MARRETSRSRAAVPLALTAVIGFLTVLTPHDVPFSRLLPAAPALAASVWSVRATLALGLICLLPVIGYALVLSDMTTLYTAGAIGAVTLAAVYASHLRLQREHTLAQVRAVADATQEVLLRPVPDRVRNLEIATLYLAAAPQARIGGDFYAAADTPTACGSSSETCAARACARWAPRPPSSAASTRPPTKPPTCRGWHTAWTPRSPGTTTPSPPRTPRSASPPPSSSSSPGRHPRLCSQLRAPAAAARPRRRHPRRRTREPLTAGQSRRTHRLRVPRRTDPLHPRRPAPALHRRGHRDP